MKRVLIIDNDQAMLQTLTGLLKLQGGFLIVHDTQDTSQAKEFLANYPIDIIIAVIRPASFDILEFIATSSEEDVAGKIIAITSNPHRQTLDTIKRIPSVIHLDHSHDILMLTKRVYTELQIDYGGKIRGVNLSSFLQMMELEGSSCTLQVSVKDKVGFLWLQNGEIIAAQTTSFKGEVAALEVISWSNVMIDIDYTPHEVDKDISNSLITLLLESGQLSDERQSKIVNQRMHERHDLLLTVEYKLGDTTRQCILHDISQGGAYIETEQEIEKGRTLTLSLASKKLQTSCTVDAIVSRVDKNGVGLRFITLNSFQEQLVQALIDSSYTAEQTRTENSDIHPAQLL